MMSRGDAMAAARSEILDYEEGNPNERCAGRSISRVSRFQLIPRAVTFYSDQCWRGPQRHELTGSTASIWQLFIH